MRIAVGLSIIVGSIYIGHRLQLEQYRVQTIRFNNCVASGRTEKLCSFISVFSPERFNEAGK